MKFASLFLVIGSLATSLVFADQQVDNFSTEEFDSALSLGEELMDSVDGVQSFCIRIHERCESTEFGDETEVDEGNHRQCARFCKGQNMPVFTLSKEKKKWMCRCNNEDCKNWQAQKDINYSFVHRIKTDNGNFHYEKVKKDVRCWGWGNGKEFQDFYKVRPKNAKKKEDCAKFCHDNYALEWFSFNFNKNDRTRCICWAARDDCEKKKSFPGYTLYQIHHW